MWGKNSINKNQRLLLVSNREPYSHEKTKQGVICKKSVGGVVSALDPLIQDCKGVWVAWGSGSADFTVCNSNDEVLVPENDPKYILKRVRLSEEEVDNYYGGYSNRVIWPLFHLFVEKMRIKERYWDSYRKVNQKFADVVLEEMSSEDWIWVQDYHLSLVPYFIRKARSDAKIAFFWHIPWPPWEVFGSLPQRDDLLEGMLNSDLIGFHTSSYVRNFLECAGKKSGVKVNKKSKIVTLSDNRTKIRHFPIGISYDDFANPASSLDVINEASELKKMHKERELILGIDRLDYTKGILDRIKAFEFFLQENPDFREKVVMVQIATPSRDDIEEYCDMKKEIDEAVGHINGRFGTEEWAPVMYFYRKIPQQSLLAYYQAADIGLLTPLRDGMNLIAKEFAAAKGGKDGVLILSEFAGASEELSEAIRVNPYDIKETAGAIKAAVEMSSEERKRRFQSMKKKVKKHDSNWWLNSFLKEWERTYV